MFTKSYNGILPLLALIVAFTVSIALIIYATNGVRGTDQYWYLADVSTLSAGNLAQAVRGRRIAKLFFAQRANAGTFLGSDGLFDASQSLDTGKHCQSHIGRTFDIACVTQVHHQTCFLFSDSTLPVVTNSCLANNKYAARAVF